MTTPLETRYRRLLAAYPSEHRRVYEDEMLGVLMAGSRPGQRRPGLAEAADLLWSGLRARVDRSRSSLREGAWPDAGAVVGLLGAAVLAAVPAYRLFAGSTFLSAGYPMHAYVLDGLLLDVTVRFAAWLAVVIAVVVGARRVAAGLGVVAAAVEVGALARWSTQLPDRLVARRRAG